MKNFLERFSVFFPESPETLGLNKKTMDFSKEREVDYKLNTVDAFLSKKRIGMIFGIIMVVLLATADFIIMPGVAREILLIRVGIAVSLLFFSISLSYYGELKLIFDRIIFGVMIVMALVQLTALYLMPIETAGKLQLSYMIIIMFSGLVMSPSFKLGSIMIAVQSLMYLMFLFLKTGLLAEDRVFGFVSVLLTSGLVIAVMYHFEYIKRRNFVFFNSDAGAPNPENSQAFEAKKSEALLLSNKRLQSEVEGLKAKIKSESERHAAELKKMEAKISEDAIFSEEFESAEVEALLLKNENLQKELDELKEKVKFESDLGSAKLKETEAFISEKLEETKTLITEKEALLREVEMLKNQSRARSEAESREMFIREQELLIGEKNELNSRLEKLSMDMASGLKEKDSEIERMKLAQTKLEEAKKAEIETKQKKISELEHKLSAISADLDDAMLKNRELEDLRDIRITEKSLDDIKLMGRLGTFISMSMTKSLSENLQYYNDKQAEFKDSKSKHYLEITRDRAQENLYQAGSISLKFDIFRRYLENTGPNENKIDVARNIQSAMAQLASYFSGTEHAVEVVCKDNILARITGESFKLILQNFVMTSLSSAARIGIPALIKIFVREEKSKVVIEYEDNGKLYAAYYNEILKLKEINSNIVSVNGMEIFLARHIVKRETGGELSVSSVKDINKITMSFFK